VSRCPTAHDRSPKKYSPGAVSRACNRSVRTVGLVSGALAGVIRDFVVRGEERDLLITSGGFTSIR
jgi:hypothetical protein